MKRFSYMDIAFFVVTTCFILLSIGELIKIIAPYYSFTKAVVVFVVFLIVYIYQKNKSFFSSLISKNVDINSEENLEGRGTRRSVYIEFLLKHKTIITHTAFILTSIIAIVSFIYDLETVALYISVMFLVLYFCMKLLGFQFYEKLEKTSPRNINTLRFFLITFGLYIIVLSKVFTEVNMGEEQRGVWYVILGLVYIICGGITFSSWNFKRIRFFSVYNTMSFAVIFGLIGMIAYQNNFFQAPEQETPTEALNPIEVITEEQEVFIDPVATEEIISDEVQISYETKQVAEVYSIQAGIQLGSSGISVSDLQSVLGNLQYYLGDIDGEFDEETRISLRNALIAECNWPESTRGIFGPQAKTCVDTLDILVPAESIIEEDLTSIGGESEVGEGEIEGEGEVGEEFIEQERSDTNEPNNSLGEILGA